MIRSPDQFRHSSCSNGRGGTGREDVSGGTCRELLEAAAFGEAERLETLQLTESFGE